MKSIQISDICAVPSLMVDPDQIASVIVMAISGIKVKYQKQSYQASRQGKKWSFHL